MLLTPGRRACVFRLFVPVGGVSGNHDVLLRETLGSQERMAVASFQPRQPTEQDALTLWLGEPRGFLVFKAALARAGRCRG